MGITPVMPGLHQTWQKKKLHIHLARVHWLNFTYISDDLFHLLLLFSIYSVVNTQFTSLLNTPLDTVHLESHQKAEAGQNLSHKETEWTKQKKKIYLSRNAGPWILKAVWCATHGACLGRLWHGKAPSLCNAHSQHLRIWGIRLIHITDLHGGRVAKALLEVVKRGS